MIIENVMRVIRVYGAKLKEHVGKLFIVSSDEAAFDEICKNITSEISQQERLFPLTPVLVKNLSELEDDSLTNAIEAFGANIVGLVLDPEEGAPSFMMERVPEDSITVEADLFAHKLDKSNKNAISTMMENMADNDPESLQRFIENVGLDLASLSVTRGGRKTAAQREEDLKQYSANFLSNMQIVRNPEGYAEDQVDEARRQVKVVISNISHATLSEFMYEVILTRIVPDDNAIDVGLLNLESAAKRSDVHLLIRPRLKNEKIINSDGKYHLTFQKGENAPKHIRFPGKVETAIFYTILMVRKKTGADMIEILDLKKEFIGIYRALYVATYEEAELAFESIKDYYVEDGETKIKLQGRYRNYIPNIRAAINEALSGSDNPAIYHYAYHYEKGGRFYVQGDHIFLDEDFLKESKRLQNPNEQASFL